VRFSAPISHVLFKQQPVSIPFSVLHIIYHSILPALHSDLCTLHSGHRGGWPEGPWGLCDPFSSLVDACSRAMKHAAGSISSCCRSSGLRACRYGEPFVNSSSVLVVIHPVVSLAPTVHRSPLVPSSSCTRPMRIVSLTTCGYQLQSLGTGYTG
jgi:hypothetical protein